jgi:hypothetical protein
MLSAYTKHGFWQTCPPGEQRAIVCSPPKGRTLCTRSLAPALERMLKSDCIANSPRSGTLRHHNLLVRLRGLVVRSHHWLVRPQTVTGSCHLGNASDASTRHNHGTTSGHQEQ